TVTVNLRRGSRSKVDTQIWIKDPRRGQRDAAVEKAVADAERKLEQRASERADALILGELLERGADIREPKGKLIARNDEAIVLRAKALAGIGKRKYLLFSVENRSGELFEVRSIRVAGQSTQALGWKMARTSLLPGEEAHGAVLLPEGGGNASRGRL